MQLRILGACVLALLVVACGGETVSTEQQQELGTVQFPMTSTAPNGKLYRLVGATLEVVGPQTVTVTDTSTSTVMVPLTVGGYTAKLGGTWRLEDAAAPGVTVAAQLVSPNPLPFFVYKDQPTEVRFQFKLASEGTADVGIRVDKGGWLSGTIEFTSVTSPTSPGPFDELVGKSVPFLISYESATIRKDGFSGNKELNVTTDRTTFQFGGTPSEVLARAAASMKGATINFVLRADSSGNVILTGLHPMTAPNPESFRLEMMGSRPFLGVLDSEGYPALRPFQAQTDFATLRDAGSSSVRGTAIVNGTF